LLDADGRLSVSQSESLLNLLKNNESTFKSELLELPEDERQVFRRRYSLLADFLNSAIQHDSPIDTFM